MRKLLFILILSISIQAYGQCPPRTSGGYASIKRYDPCKPGGPGGDPDCVIEWVVTGSYIVMADGLSIKDSISESFPDRSKANKAKREFDKGFSKAKSSAKEICREARKRDKQERKNDRRDKSRKEKKEEDPEREPEKRRGNNSSLCESYCRGERSVRPPDCECE